jgi:membrane-bound lytic murein transglycosylase D
MPPIARSQLALTLALALAPTPALSQAIDSTGGQARVADYVRYFTGPGRDRMNRWLARGSQFRGMIQDRLAEEGLPADLEYLPLIESGYSNDAVSKAGAVGMWQFIPETARRYGLRVDRYVDERRDPFRATDAAVRHMRDLTREFGSPLLAAAAYNGGAGLVRRGLARLRSLDSLGRTDSVAPLPDDFFRLRDRSLLPRETREYVPQLLAAATIGADPSRFGFVRPAGTGFGFDSVAVRRSVNLGAAAHALGLGPRTIQGLNPHFIRGATPPGSSWLRVPLGFADRLRNELATLPSIAPRTERTYARVRVKRGETVEGIARRYGVGPDDLRRSNALPKIYRLRPGQMLWIRQGAPEELPAPTVR